MHLLIDANLSPTVASALNRVGFKASHVVDVGLVTAPDNEILAYALANESVIISADSDSANYWRLHLGPHAHR
jgi:predicted nuclease of predicted toxin-antitoxin system